MVDSAKSGFRCRVFGVGGGDAAATHPFHRGELEGRSFSFAGEWCVCNVGGERGFFSSLLPAECFVFVRWSVGKRHIKREKKKTRRRYTKEIQKNNKKKGAFPFLHHSALQTIQSNTHKVLPK